MNLSASTPPAAFTRRGKCPDVNACQDGWQFLNPFYPDPTLNIPAFDGATMAGLLHQMTTYAGLGSGGVPTWRRVQTIYMSTDDTARRYGTSNDGTTFTYAVGWKMLGNSAGWSTATLSANWSGNVAYRKVGGRVDVALNVSPSASYSNTIAVIPHVPADPWPGASYISVPAGNFSSAPAIRSSLLGIETATGSVPGAIVAGVVGFLAGGYVRGYFSYYTAG